MTERRAQRFNAWVHAIPYAGIRGAVHYRWNGTHWVDHRYAEAQRLLDARGIDYILRQDGEDFSVWTHYDDD